MEHYKTVLWRRGGLTVCGLVSGSSGLGSSPGWGHCVVLLYDSLLTQCLSPRVYIWVPVNLMLRTEILLVAL